MKLGTGKNKAKAVDMTRWTFVTSLERQSDIVGYFWKVHFLFELGVKVLTQIRTNTTWKIKIQTLTRLFPIIVSLTPGVRLTIIGNSLGKVFGSDFSIFDPVKNMANRLRFNDVNLVLSWYYELFLESTFPVGVRCWNLAQVRTKLQQRDCAYFRDIIMTW